MKKRLLNIITILVITFVLSGCADNQDETIKIGSIHPLTGSMAYEGQAMVNAQQIAIDEINKNGGINGKQLELVAVDSMGTSSGAANAALKLINRDVVALTGTYTSSSAQIVSRSAEKAGVPFVVTVASSDNLLSNGYQYTFRIQPSTVTFSENFLNYIDFIKTEDMKTVAFIYENSNYGTGIAEYINEHIGETGLEVVGMISYPATASTLSSEVTRLAAMDPDMLIPIGYYSDQSLLAKELLERDIKFDTIVGVANGAFSDAKFTATYGTKVDGIYDINYRYNPKSEEAQFLLQAYLDRYGEEIPVAAIYGYESIMVLADALRRTEGEGPEYLREALAFTKLEKHVLPQKAIEFAENGENIRSAGVMIQIQNGKQVVVYPEEYAEGAIVKVEEEEK